MLDTDVLFLCRVLKKSHIGYDITTLNELASKLATNKSGLYHDLSYSDSLEIVKYLSDLLPKALYRVTDSFDRKYLLFYLNDSSELMIMGPYLSLPASEERINGIFNSSNITANDHSRLTEYFLGLPVIEPSSPFSFFLTSFCEGMWKTDSVSVIDIYCQGKSADAAYNANLKSTEASDVLLNMKAMEMRYTFENDMIRAVSLGQLYMEEKLFSTINNSFFESRAKDPLRNAKNYGIIMNTLSRKAAEQGGVHPIHLNRVSTQIALKIESLTSLSEVTDLLCHIFRTYCRLVRKHSVQKYSPVVQKALIIIDADLSANLSTGAIAKALGISTVYLSTVFKKELGVPMSEYVLKKRISYAAHLLSTTDTQIQAIATRCGIMDTQYFSKLFKKVSGLSPTQYRAKSKKKATR